MFQVKVKWNKKTFECDLDPTGGLDLFKSTVFSLTGVDPERMKIMVRGKLIKSDDQLTQIKAGTKFLVTGSATAVAEGPKVKVLFEEDLNDQQRQELLSDAVPAGLKNLGNTCYLAATVQCLKAIPELRSALAPLARDHSSPKVSSELARLFDGMDQTSDAVVPSTFVHLIRRLNPVFDSHDERGGPEQQDAEEFYTWLINECRREVPAAAPSAATSALDHPAGSLSPLPNLLEGDGAAAAAPQASASASAAASSNIIDSLLAYRRVTTVKCQEADEPAEVAETTSYQLECDVTKDTNHLHQGVQQALNTTLTKRSPTLGRDATYSSSSVMASLPKALTLRLTRFGFRIDNKKATKKLRRVQFQLRMDLYDSLEPELKKKVGSFRQALLDHRDRERELRQRKALQEARAASAAAATAAGTEPDEAVPMDVDLPVVDEKVLKEGPTGFFELVGVVSHQGTSVNAGHYVGWVKRADDFWIKFDDDVVTKQSNEDILKLAGGGQWHMGYMLFYRRIEPQEEIDELAREAERKTRKK